jgi:FAD/FMN-containing dehydrogenase
LASALDNGVITGAVIATSEAQAAALWRIRHSVSEGNKRAGFGVTHDTAVPLRAQADFTRSIERRIPAEFPEAKLLMVGHMGDGNIHVVALFDPKRYTQTAMKHISTRINAIVDEVTLGLRGTISAEHGIGQTNKQRLLEGRGHHDVALMQRIKAALDPDGLFNPGKMFDLPS